MTMTYRQLKQKIEEFPEECLDMAVVFLNDEQRTEKLGFVKIADSDDDPVKIGTPFLISNSILS